MLRDTPLFFSPSSESCFSLLSCSICWHQASMRPVSACRSRRKQCPSLRHAAGAPGCSDAPFMLTLTLCRDGGGGGREDGSRATSMLSGMVEENFCNLSALLGQLSVWVLQAVLLLADVLPSVRSWVSVSAVSCLDAMLLKRLSLDTHTRVHTHTAWGNLEIKSRADCNF